MPDLVQIYHHDDFDGLAAAAIVAWWRRSFGDRTIAIPVNHDLKGHWGTASLRSKTLPAKIAVLDFPYHRDADYFADHHPTGFYTPEDRAHFEARPKPTADQHTFMTWQTTAKSTPRVLANVFAEYGWEWPERFVDLATYGDIVDAAGYESAEEAIFDGHPAFTLARVLERDPRQIVRTIAFEELAAGTLADVVAHPFIAALATAMESKTRSAIDTIKQRLEPDDVGLLTYERKDVFERFAPYLKEVGGDAMKYLVTLRPLESGEWKIGIGVNPWVEWGDKGSPFDVGAFCASKGGGGHRVVGGCSAKDRDGAMAIADEARAQIRAALKE